MIASRPRISLFEILLGHFEQSKCTISVWPFALASINGVWCSSFKEIPAASWPRERSVVQQGREPREAARWRDVFERPRGVGSGFWRREGWDLRMRRRRRGSELWIARRRRREGSILWRAVLA